MSSENKLISGDLVSELRTNCIESDIKEPINYELNLSLDDFKKKLWYEPGGKEFREFILGEK